MIGWILYDKEGFTRNSTFAEILCKEGKRRGFDMKIVVDDRIDYAIVAGVPTLYLDGDISAPDFVIRRNYCTMLALHMENMGIKVLNNARACEVCNNKLRTAQEIQKLGIGIADTYFKPRKAPFFPCVVKPSGGHGGNNVFLAENGEEYEQTIKMISDDVVVQSVEDKGKDLRTYVSGTTIISSVMRTCESDFRSNFSLGGRAEIHSLTEQERQIVLKVAQAFDFDFAGIDIIYRNGEPILNEIEDVAGCRMLYANGITSVPSHIFDRVELRLKERI